MRYVGLGLSVLAAIGAMSVASAQRPAGPLEGNASISGRVIDGRTGAPVAGAVVSISFGGNAPQPPAVLAGADGRFSLGRLPAGKATLSSEKAGYQRSEYGRLRIGGGGTEIQLTDTTRMTDAVIRIWQLGFVSGRVLDESGRPVTGRSIEAFALTSSEKPAFSPTFTSSFTNDLGEYELETLPGQHAVGVIMRTSTFPTSGVVSSFFAHSDVITAGPPKWLNVVSSADGQWWHRLENAPLLPLQTGAGHMLTYTTTYFPSASSFSTATLVTVEPGRERAGVDIHLRQSRGYRVTGKVSIPLRPSSGAEATLISDPVAERSGVSMATATGRVDGAFAFFGVPPGNYTLVVRRVITTENLLADDMVPMTVRLPIAVGNQDVTDLSVTLRESVAARVTGTIDFGDHSPTQEINVGLKRVDEKGGLGTQATRRPDFAITSVPPGRYIVTVYSATLESATLNGRNVAIEPFDVGTNDVRDLVIRLTRQGTRVSGVVRNRAGVPTSDAQVVMFPANPAVWSTAEFHQLFKAVRARQAGDYVLGGFPTGEYYIAAVDEAEMDRWPSLRFLEELAATARRIQLAPGVMLTHDLRVGGR